MSVEGVAGLGAVCILIAIAMLAGGWGLLIAGVVLVIADSLSRMGLL